MKRSILLLFVVFGLTTGWAQAPYQFNFQAVARNLAGNPMTNATVDFRLSIVQGDPDGAVVYIETQSTQTNNFGLANLLVGSGVADLGSLATLDWMAGPYFLRIELADNDGNYLLVGSSPLMSVPYALHAKTSEQAGPQGPQGEQGPQGIQGEQGPVGATGNGIVSTTDNGDGTFTLTYADGSTFTTPDLTGPQGEQGLKGDQGDQGPQGIQGEQGPVGATGNGIASTTDNGDGTFTFTYDDGSTFTTSDLTGPQGAQGAQGPQGIQGVTGATGAQGIQGDAGPQGLPGTNGTDGLSAYEVWLNEGNVGTQADFINAITGPQGATGPQGSQGIQGVQGPAGPTGATGATGNGIVSTTDNGDGSFTLTYADGSTFTTPDLTGPAGSEDAWSLTGNTGTDQSTNFIGTTDAQDFVIKTNNSERLRVLSSGEVGIGTVPDASAKLEVSSTTQGFLPPRLTTTERDAITTPAVGLVIYNTTTNCLNFFVGSGWNEVCGTASLPLGVVSGLNCGSATNLGTLTEGTPASGVTSEVPYTGGNGGTYNGQTVASTGVTGLTATLAAGTFANGAGSLTYTITGTPSAVGTTNFELSIHGQICVLSRTVDIPVGVITSLDCSEPSLLLGEGLVEGVPVENGQGVYVNYDGASGGLVNGQTVNSTGVSGLSATPTDEVFADEGEGVLFISISGTPISAGTAFFLLSVGGQSCTLELNVAANLAPQYPSGSVFCVSGPTAIIEVTNPATGKTWMDRNLGASQVATSSADEAAYGNLYQWGRRSDGHQCRTSPTTSTLSSTDQPTHGDFITTNDSPFDWRSPQNSNLWQGVNGVNNPCPSGYRLPTEAELNAELTSWISNDAAGAFASPLKWTMAGDRSSIDGLLRDVGDFGGYWSGNFNSTDSRFLFIVSESAGMSDSPRASALSVRCIKDTPATLGYLDCGSATTTGALVAGQAAGGLTTSVPYTGGNGGTYSAQSISSTGVTGLTAELTAGQFANGTGTIVYTITGIPSAAGAASFEINIGGESCNVEIPVDMAQLTAEGGVITEYTVDLSSPSFDHWPQDLDGVTFRVHAFCNSGTFNVTQLGENSADNTVDVLVVGGGGAGSQVDGGGGGGGGAVVEHLGVSISEGSYPVLVGAGGAALTGPFDGGMSSFLGFVAEGGGSGAGSGLNGGSAGTGHLGGVGNGFGCSVSLCRLGGGGGGGATSDGIDAILLPTWTNNWGQWISEYWGGNGGSGFPSDLRTGLIEYYGGGGGGGSASGDRGMGVDGGGNGAALKRTGPANDVGISATPGADCKGGGGGGAALDSGDFGIVPGLEAKNGGSGVVIIRYRLD